MIENDLDKVLDYMNRYVENVYEHDSEIMLNWKDIKLVLEEIERLNNIIKEVREYIENNDLYEQDYDYDYEENLVVGPPNDETARKILLGILDKVEE